MANQDQSDMAEFFDFGQAALPDLEMNGAIDDVSPGQQIDSLPDLPADTLATNDTNTDWSNFSIWLPSYRRPEKPCDYCSSKHLDCRFSMHGQLSCEACNNLFRACSFVTLVPKSKAIMDTLASVNEDACVERGQMTGCKAMLSYDRAGADAQDNDGDERPSRKSGTRFSRAAIKVLKDWMEQHKTNPYPTEEEKEELKLLTGLKTSQISGWFANTRRRTKIHTPRGVSPSLRRPTWANEQTSAVDIPFDKASIRHNGKTWDIMNPLERYIESPPENEPAPIRIIKDVAEQSGLHPSSSGSSLRRGVGSSAGSGSFSQQRAPSMTSLETGRTDSLQSSASLSNLSLGSSHSYGSRNSFGSHASGDRLKRRRRRRTAANPGRNQPIEQRHFKCTFCTDTFKTKHDWSRHEKTLHLSLEKFICAPLGPVIMNPATGKMQCVYCDMSEPSVEHIASHHHDTCEEKGIPARTFFRKDHLRQHLRLVHGCKLIESMESWKVEAATVRSRCGFCAQWFTTWQERTDHLAKHFKSGACMNQWKGCRGFDPEVAALVQNAMPPYLIANEAKSPLPFSASNTQSMRQHSIWLPASQDLEAVIGDSGGLGPDPHFSNSDSNDLSPDSNSEIINFSAGDENFINQCTLAGMSSGLEAYSVPSDMMNFPGNGDFTGPLSPSQERREIRVSSCWQILTLRLGHFVREQAALGIVPTDEQLQAQARWILFSDDDSWNQTAADNPEWLDIFKRAHGLEAANPPPPARDAVIEDLGIDTHVTPAVDRLLDDFGYDINRAMDLNAAYNEVFPAQAAPPASSWADILASVSTAPAHSQNVCVDEMLANPFMPGSLLPTLETSADATAALYPFADLSTTAAAGFGGFDISTAGAGQDLMAFDFASLGTSGEEASVAGMGQAATTTAGGGLSGLSMLFAGQGV